MVAGTLEPVPRSQLISGPGQLIPAPGQVLLQQSQTLQLSLQQQGDIHLHNHVCACRVC